MLSGLLGILLATIALTWTFSQSVSDGWGVVVLFGATLAGWPLGIAVHETGHAIAARAVGLTVPVVTVGRGELFKRFQIGRTRVDLRRGLWRGGMTLPLGADDDPGRLARAIYILGGCVANAVAATAAFCLSPQLRGLGAGAGIAASGLFGLGLPQAYMAVGNLLPFRTSEQTASDGLSLWRLVTTGRSSDPVAPLLARVAVFLRAGLFDAAASSILRAFELAPQDPFVVSLVIHCLSRLQGDLAATEWALMRAKTLADSGAAEEPAMAWLWANIAWSALKAGRSDLGEEIDAYSRLAFEKMPDRPEMRGTRGAVLVWRGDFVTGAPLLVAAIRHAGDRIDRADFCAFLSNALAIAGEGPRAAAFSEVSERFRVAARSA